MADQLRLIVSALTVKLLIASGLVTGPWQVVRTVTLISLQVAVPTTCTMASLVALVPENDAVSPGANSIGPRSTVSALTTTLVMTMSPVFLTIPEKELGPAHCLISSSLGVWSTSQTALLVFCTSRPVQRSRPFAVSTSTVSQQISL